VTFFKVGRHRLVFREKVSDRFRCLYMCTKYHVGCVQSRPSRRAIVCMLGVYCGARINFKSKSTAQNVLEVKSKFKTKLYNCITESQTASYMPSVRMMDLPVTISHLHACCCCLQTIASNWFCLLDMLMTNHSLDANLQTLWRGTLIQQSATLRASTEASHPGPNSMN